ncbi:MAG: ribonuclease HI family protein [bacterium]|nr:ribonuclease HI family protein [bacterium]
MIEIYIDGACSGNPGPAAIGAIGYQEAKELFTISRPIGEATNNIAEYKALIAALKHSKAEGFNQIKIYSDSELLVKQMCGEYRVKDLNLKSLYQEATRLCKKIENIEIVHISREKNKRANNLAQGGVKKSEK